MSKIQEALARIQATKSASRREIAGKKIGQSESVVLAKLVDNGAVGSTKPVGATGAGNRFLEIDRDALKEAGLLAPEYHERLLADQYRDIKRPLIAHAFGKRATKIENGNLIMVTSAVAGEGKTFTSINLALSMAREKDHTVILIDADVAKPHVSSIFGASDEPGLLDAIEDRTLKLHELLLPTDVQGLSFLPAGRPRHHSTELLASARMDELATELREEYPSSLVVLDTPPLLQTSESKVLAAIAGQIVMVVRAEATSKDAVLTAIDMFSDTKAVNLILNQVRNAKVEYQYGYGYGQ